MDEDQHPSRAVDRIVGGNLRTRRTELRLSQADLGRVLGVSHQQVAKYEDGRDRITVGRLAAAADHLGCRVEWFFDPDNEVAPPRRRAVLLPLDALLPDFTGDGLSTRVFFTVHDAAAAPAVTIDVVALVDPASSRTLSVLPRALHPAMLRNGAAALLAAAAGDGRTPLAIPDAAPRAGAALN